MQDKILACQDPAAGSRFGLCMPCVFIERTFKVAGGGQSRLLSQPLEASLPALASTDRHSACAHARAIRSAERMILLDNISFAAGGSHFKL